ncbi:sensor histidine kinase [Enterococcus pallens]|uniref:Sensor histidine kinase NatK-like C-terminal domain-containing protein n=1 Tax=Enterococcus pallens ATCC BAA-351 TaxID=1158607 RepID=R2SSG0_9ENTE|nr:sensor histidine kinase [Enterococcus pallens]EOH91009.1 hypothetical protein UAU_03548 [Enterococcus pallens ATCC BAA-351]EOU16205.1 hypothetical protein I588_03861 [Enterococcus pallens ATCC BAA-351]
MPELVSQIIHILINYVPVTLIIAYPLWNRKSVKGSTFIILISSNLLLACLIYAHLYSFIGHDTTLFKLYLGLISVTRWILFAIIFKKHLWKLLFLICCSGICVITFTGIGNWIESRITVYGDGPVQYFYSNIVSFLVAALITIPSAYYLKKMIDQAYSDQFKMWRLVWLIPCLFFFIGSISGNLENYRHIYSFSFIATRIVSLIALVLILFLLSSLLKQASENMILTENKHRIEMQTQLQTEQYARILNDIETAKRNNHDLRHHLHVISRYQQEKEYEKLSEYLNRLIDVTEHEEKTIYCKNYAASALLGYYAPRIREKNIHLEHELHIPNDCPTLSDIELCVVLGNCLENAVEACERMQEGERFIRIQSHIQGGFLKVIISNSFDGLLEEQSVRIYSSKRIERGVGLDSVEAITQKLNGYMACRIEDHTFHTTILLQI